MFLIDAGCRVSRYAIVNAIDCGNLRFHLYGNSEGARDDAGINKLQRYFSTQQFYGFEQPQASYEAAAFMFFSCHRQGGNGTTVLLV